MASSSDSRITQLANEGCTTAEIAARLGMNQLVIQRTCSKLGLFPPRDTTAMPYGITDASYGLRMVLGSIIVDMKESGKPAREISTITGLSRMQLANASSRPYRHDWTLSQIERTLAYDNKILKEILCL